MTTLFELKPTELNSRVTAFYIALEHVTQVQEVIKGTGGFVTLSDGQTLGISAAAYDRLLAALKAK